MKKVVNVSLGGRNFILDEDAYTRLQEYLDHFKGKLTVPEHQKTEVMEEIEGRIAELFFQEVGDGSRVVTLEMVQKVTSALGMPDGSAEGGFSNSSSASKADLPRRLYRDVDNKSVAGVCSGLALYFDIDITLIRILMLVALIFGSAGHPYPHAGGPHLRIGRILDLCHSLDCRPQGRYSGQEVRDARHSPYCGEHVGFRP